IAFYRGLRPHVRDPIGRGLQDLDRHRAGESLPLIGQERAHPLAGERVGDEDDATVPSGHAKAAVGEAGNVKLDLHRLASGGTLRAGAPRIVPDHPTSLGAPVRLTLASTSPSRLELLRMAGIEPTVAAPDVDEDAVARAAGE